MCATSSTPRWNDIYLHDYWLAGRCDRMPWPVSLAHFDACVNTGVTQAAKFLQRTVSTRDDGLIGPLTLGALKLVLEREVPGGAGRAAGPPAHRVLPTAGEARPRAAGISAGLAQPGGDAGSRCVNGRHEKRRRCGTVKRLLRFNCAQNLRERRIHIFLLQQ
jgi:hypothetical protein